MTATTHSSVGQRDKSGVTLIELLVAVAVLGVLLAMAAPSMADLMEKRRVIAAAQEVAGILTYAKAETNSTNALLYVRFDPDPAEKMSCAAVTTSGGINTCACYLPDATMCLTGGGQAKLLRLFQLPADHVKFVAAATTWDGPANRIKFMRTQMTMATTDFHVDVVGKRSAYALRVEVNTAGRVSVCSPNGDMNGYAKCL